ncbi:transcriptional regulator of RNA polII, SAGA, subunit-domain-containing protein [Plectosphaerella plurivora]|uniref:Transcriptional regulator of RNA polII, SAGA, subunit-domain-containing protein n=1 Tax=Plectosphaerella plurivora TaxID=936078 RepID=A0A9P8VNB5_9PEZI|nr:transcriptional regulator of RNA polII, SAGA, subunit-domain-containing protein [Plectosphaerella plurivora]
MPDIDPAALSRPSISLTTPILSNKSLPLAPGSLKAKTSQIIPARIDLEPLYTALKQAIGSEQWVIYKEALTQYLIGRLNQTEYSDRIDPIISSPNGEKEHLHNQLIAAIYGNVTREMPDQGLAPWVSANDKPSTSTGSKPASGDASERRLKGEVMQLPARDRRRIKDLVGNDYDPHESMASAYTEPYRRASKAAEVPASANPLGAAGGINNMNLDLEIRKRYAQPLAIESGEFPDASLIESRMLPICYEIGLTNGHSSEAAQLITAATETYIKEVISSVFSKTRSNGPGDSGNAGLGVPSSWIQTHRYRRQLAIEEESAHRGELTRDKSGLLPIEAKAAGERGPLAMSDLRLALEMAENGMSNFPIITTAVAYGYRDGELENWHDYTWLPGMEETLGQYKPSAGDLDIRPQPVNAHPDAMDIDTEEMTWEGADGLDSGLLDGVLDSCLAVGS